VLDTLIDAGVTDIRLVIGYLYQGENPDVTPGVNPTIPYTGHRR